MLPSDMTASVSVAAEMPPSTTPPPSQLSALQEKLTAVEALLTGLRAENHRLQAALAVERAARDADELTCLRRDVHLVRHRLSRALRVFDTLGLESPSMEEPIHSFIDDDFLEQLPQRVTANLKERDVEAPKAVDDFQKPSPKHPDNAPETVTQNGNEKASPGKHDNSEEPRKSPVAPTDASIGPEPSKGFSPSSQQRSAQKALPDDTTPVHNTNITVECLRMLIGADSIVLSDDPTRIKIEMRNPEKKRALSFWLAWKGNVICYTREAVQVEEDSCPMFLKEYSIEFEVSQAPNFLVLVMGAMFDFKVKPKSEPKLEDDAAHGDETMRDDDTIREDGTASTPS